MNWHGSTHPYIHPFSHEFNYLRFTEPPQEPNLKPQDPQINPLDAVCI